jgi:predicted transcriptional regulator
MWADCFAGQFVKDLQLSAFGVEPFRDRRSASLIYSSCKTQVTFMNAKDAIRSSANVSLMVLKSYISDLEDSDLLKRPTEGCNHIAYQLGHLICSEVQLLEMVAPGNSVDLPDGFADNYSKENAGDDNPEHFQDKATYLQLMDKVREATLAALDGYAESDLDKESPEHLRSFCPTMGDVFTLIATHPMMHAGQFVVVRRQLEKPILM